MKRKRAIFQLFYKREDILRGNNFTCGKLSIIMGIIIRISAKHF